MDKGRYGVLKWVMVMTMVMLVVFVPNVSYGALPTYTSDPETHYNRHGDEILYMSNHSIAFGDKGTPTTATIRTHIIGYTTTVTANGRSAKVIWKLGNSTMSGWTSATSGISEREKKVGSTTYYLSEIKYSTLHEKVKAADSTLGNYLARGDYNVSIEFDAITEVYNASTGKVLDGPNYTITQSRDALSAHGISRYILDPYYGMMMYMDKSDLPVVNYVSKAISFPQGGNYYSGGTYYIQEDKEVNISTKFRSNIVNMDRQYLWVGDEDGGANNVDDFRVYFQYNSSSSPYGSFTTYDSTNGATVLTGAGSTANNADRDANVRFDFRLRGDGDYWYAYGEAKNDRGMFEGGYEVDYRLMYRMRVDGSAPTISGRLSSAWRNTDASFTPAVSDSVSGIDEVKFYRNGTLIQTITPSTRDTGVTLSTQNPTSSTTYRVTMKDNVGNTSSSDFSVNIDKVDPTISLTPNKTGWSDSDVSVAYSMADSGGSGIDTITLPDGRVTTSSVGTFNVSSTGTYTFTVTDNAGNSTSKSVSVYIDKTDPNGSLSSSNTSWTDGNVVLNLTGLSDSGGSGFDRVVLPNNTTSNGSSNVSYTVTSNGTYTFKLYDNAGNLRNLSINVSNIDKTAPVGSVSANTTSWTNGNVVLSMGGVSDSGGSGFKEIVLPNGSTTTSTTPTYTATSNGTYTFKIRDNAGNEASRSISVSNIDKTAPTIGGDSKSPSSWTNGNVSVGLTSVADSGGSGLDYVVLPNNSTNANVSTTYSVSSNGSYTFRVFDNAGNSTTRTVTVGNIDKTDPTGTLSRSTSSWTDSNVTLNLTGLSDSGGSGFDRVVLPNNTTSDGAANVSYSVSSNGTYTFKLYDNAGNVENLSITVSNIDKTDPVGTVSANTTSWTKGNVVLSMSGVSDSGGSGFKEIVLPNGSTTTSSTPTYTATSNGTYTFKIRDNAGNEASRSITVSNIDKTVPTIGGDSKTPSSWTNGNVSVGLTSVADSGGSGIDYIEFPNGTTNANVSTKYTVTSNGSYAFSVFDNAGNKTTRNVTVTNIDKTDPTGTLSKSSSSWTNGVIALNLTGLSDSGGSGFDRVVLPDGSVSNGTGNVSYNATSNGTYSFVLHDNAGNSKVLSISVGTIDVTDPVGNLSASTTSWTNGNVVLTLSGVSDSGGSGLKNIVLPNGSSVTGTSASYTVSSNGTYTFKIYDNAGNETLKSITVSNIDKVKPTVGGDVKSPSTWTSGNVSISLSGVADSGGSGLFELELPNGTKTTNMGTSYTVASNGSYDFEVSDRAGNSVTRTVVVSNIDKVNPSGNLTQNPTAWTNGNVGITLSGLTDGSGSGVKDVRMPNGSTVTGSVPVYTVSSNGTYSYTITDNVGNTQVESISVTNIDKSLPDVTLGVSSSIWTNSDVLISYGNIVDTGGSGYKRIKLPDGTYSTALTGNYRVSSNGVYSFVVEDVAGNVRTRSVSVTNIDKAVPDFSIVADVTAFTNKDYDLRVTDLVDTASGISRIELPSGLSVSYAGTDVLYRVSDNGLYTFKVFDVAGNVTTKSIVVSNIDKVAPGVGTLTLSTYSWSKPGVRITATPGVDVGVSGVRHIEYRINGGSWNVLPATGYVIPNTFVGNVVVDARTVDNAGNISGLISKTAKIDNTLPVVRGLDIIPLEDGFSVVIDAVDDISSIRDYRIFVKEIGTDSSYRVLSSWGTSGTVNVTGLVANRAYEFYVEVRDLALNANVSSKKYGVTPPDVYKIGVRDGDYENNLTAFWSTALRGSDGIVMEIYRSGKVVNRLSDGSSFSDRNLNFEQKYVYEFKNVFEVSGEKIVSFVLKKEAITGVPSLELEMDRSVFYRTKFSDMTKLSGYMSYIQGGVARLSVGTDQKDFDLEPLIRNRFEHVFDVGTDGSIVKLDASLIGKEGIFDISREVRVDIKDVSVKKLDANMANQLYD